MSTEALREVLQVSVGAARVSPKGAGVQKHLLGGTAQGSFYRRVG